MAKKTEPSPFLLLSAETKVELIRVKGDKVFLKEMEFKEALEVMKGKHPEIEKKSDWIYRIYQIGFSQYKNVIKK